MMATAHRPRPQRTATRCVRPPGPVTRRTPRRPCPRQGHPAVQCRVAGPVQADQPLVAGVVVADPPAAEPEVAVAVHVVVADQAIAGSRHRDAGETPVPERGVTRRRRGLRQDSREPRDRTDRRDPAQAAVSEPGMRCADEPSQDSRSTLAVMGERHQVDVVLGDVGPRGAVRSAGPRALRRRRASASRSSR